MDAKKTASGTISGKSSKFLVSQYNICMRRWNGWGDEAVTYPLPDSAAVFLEEILGAFTPYHDAKWEELLAKVPESKLPKHSFINTGADARVLHARGQSLPDWIALRYGTVNRFPDGVVYANSEEEVKELLSFAYDKDICLIPYGGGTSVVGHINPVEGGNPVLTLDLSLMNKLTNLDEISRLATIQAGANGPQIEKQLQAHGYTLGHFPQSFELSTLGGWIATRSSGQQSYYYGRIEDLFAGGHVETPQGAIHLPPLPASAAGPDLRQVILGSEGRLGIITEATVRVRPIPEKENFYGVFFHDWEDGVEAVRKAAQENLPVSMLRMSDPQETQTTLILSGKDDLVRWAARGLNLLNYRENRCLLIYGITGSQRQVSQTQARAKGIFRAHKGLYTGEMIGNTWRKSRFKTPYLRNTLWERGVALDTLETALPWDKVIPAAAEIRASITKAFERHNACVLVFSHLSHVYENGASIYVTFLFLRTKDPDELLERWRAAKGSASETIVRWGGTISHQHGVGQDHAPYLEAEKSKTGLQLIQSICEAMDPKGLLNPRKLVNKPDRS
jgi:alkyldihydroxyacetonephosphate synthase